MTEPPESAATITVLGSAAMPRAAPARVSITRLVNFASYPRTVIAGLPGKDRLYLLRRLRRAFGCERTTRSLALTGFRISHPPEIRAVIYEQDVLQAYMQRSASLGFSRYLLWQFEQAVVMASAASRILS